MLIKTLKKILLISIKLAISVAIIVWLVQSGKLDITAFSKISFDGRTILLFLVGMIAVLSGTFLLTWRFCMLLEYRKFHMSFFKVLLLTWASLFFGSILPGIVSGDAIKAVYLCSNVSGRRTDAFMAVLVDRVIGLFSLLLLGALSLAVALIFHYISFSIYLLVAPAIVLSLIIFRYVIISTMFWELSFVKKIFPKLPVRVKNLVNSLKAYLKSTQFLLKIVSLSLINHALVIGSFVVSAIAIHDSLPIFMHYIINPLAMVMNVVPVTPGGIGITESAFAFLFESVGSENGAMIGLLGRLVQYSVFILAGIIAVSSLKLRLQIQALDVNQEAGD